MRYRMLLRDVVAQPTTSDHMNIKYIWGPHVNHMGTGKPKMYRLGGETDSAIR